MTVSPEEIIEGAIRGVERDGWYQGSYYPVPLHDVHDRLTHSEHVTRSRLASRAAPACTLGHLSRSAFGHAFLNYAEGGVRADNWDAWAAAKELVTGAAGVEEGGIPRWNDDPQRTKEDIILTFKRALNHEAAPNV
jgi:hypothetical protein